MIGRAAIRRRAAGGKRAVGRPSIPSADWAALKVQLWTRAGGRCECCRVPTSGPLDPEHAVASSQGGADDLDNVWLACRGCHRWKEQPYSGTAGRLEVTPLGAQRFRFAAVTAMNKWARRDGVCVERFLRTSDGARVVPTP